MLEEFANALWRLTGQPYHDNAEAWSNWWKENGDKFQILSDADLEKVRSGEEEWRLRQRDWLPSPEDRAFVGGLMQRVIEPGKVAGWIAPPEIGINNAPFDYEYVRLN